jgi:hypothetical protein
MVTAKIDRYGEGVYPVKAAPTSTLQQVGCVPTNLPLVVHGYILIWMMDGMLMVNRY